MADWRWGVAGALAAAAATAAVAAWSAADDAASSTGTASGGRGVNLASIAELQRILHERRLELFARLVASKDMQQQADTLRQLGRISSGPLADTADLRDFVGIILAHRHTQGSSSESDHSTSEQRVRACAEAARLMVQLAVDTPEDVVCDISPMLLLEYAIAILETPGLAPDPADALHLGTAYLYRSRSPEDRAAAAAVLQRALDDFGADELRADQDGEADQLCSAIRTLLHQAREPAPPGTPACSDSPDPDEPFSSDPAWGMASHSFRYDADHAEAEACVKQEHPATPLYVEEHRPAHPDHPNQRTFAL